MSIVFNDTSSLRGLVQLYEKEIGANQGDISGNTTKLKQFTADANQAFDDFVRLAISASGRWQFDDSNQTDYPIITTNLVANQRDYSFTTDGSSNLILDIYRVFVKYDSTATTYTEITPIDQQSDVYTDTFTNGANSTGKPTQYDKTGNGIFLDPIPAQNVTNGLKVYINREASYFTATDTTKKAGVPGILQKYFYLKPAADYARRNNLANAQAIMNEVIKMEGAPGIRGTITEYYALREKDDRKNLTMKRINYR